MRMVDLFGSNHIVNVIVEIVSCLCTKLAQFFFANTKICPLRKNILSTKQRAYILGYF